MPISGTVYVGPRSRRKTTVKQEDKLSELLKTEEKPLYTIRTVFPFVLFPDTIIIRPYHIDIITGVFFYSNSTTRVQISDIRELTLMSNMFFATLTITPQWPLEKVITMEYLWKGQAIRARRIISGLIESIQQQIDLTKYSTKDLSEAMEKLGKARE